MQGILKNYLSEHELAEDIHKSTRTLQRWRRLRIGPTPTIIGNHIYYHVDDVQKWLREQRREVA